MSIKARGEVLLTSDQVNLIVQFKDGMGNPVDTDAYPSISIVQPSGNIVQSLTSVGVTKVDTGKYSYIFNIPYAGPLGVWQDVWQAYISGTYVESVFSFVVMNSNVPSVNSDGYVKLGDDPGFQYSQEAVKNINKLLKMLKARLNSSGKSRSTDANGNVIYVDCDVFTIEQLVDFLAAALSYFNQIPYFTYFQFDDDAFVAQFGDILVEMATLWALASQALIERSKESSVQDQGITYTPATVSEILQTQYSGSLQLVWDQIKYIKNSMRPGPLGMGTFNMNSGVNPAYKRLRHLRARRIF